MAKNICNRYFVDEKGLNIEIEKRLLFDFSVNASNAIEDGKNEFEVVVDAAPYVSSGEEFKDKMNVNKLDDLMNMKMFNTSQSVLNARGWIILQNLDLREGEILLKYKVCKLDRK